MTEKKDPSTLKPKGRKKLYPDMKIAEKVEALSSFGVLYTEIASYCNIEYKVLTKVYAEQLEKGKAAANALVGERLYRKCKEGDITALIFWAKTRMHWRETQHVDHTNSDGTMTAVHKLPDLSKLSHSQLLELAKAVFVDKKNSK
jgi:hypothetical protein